QYALRCWPGACDEHGYGPAIFKCWLDAGSRFGGLTGERRAPHDGSARERTAERRRADARRLAQSRRERPRERRLLERALRLHPLPEARRAAALRRRQPEDADV